MNSEKIKKQIKESYGNIAKGSNQPGCCSSDTGCCTTDPYSSAMSLDYTNVEGYQKDADLSLGCGLPTEIANISVGDTVVDLGSGAGNDVFIARNIVGETGKVIGIDMTPEMVIKALQNNQTLGYKNVEFQLGEIEEMKNIADSIADVVISNCVMNLIPDKEKAFKEVFRVLKIGGHFSISDIVYMGALPDGMLEAAELYSGCVAGASAKGEYLGIIKSAGFKNIQIKKERKISLPDSLILQHITAESLKKFEESGSGFFSVTIYADKIAEGSCCETTDSGCCGSEEELTMEKASCCGKESTGGTSCC